MRCDIFVVTSVNNFCSDGVWNDGARNVKFVTEINPVPILIVRSQYFPKSTVTESDCSEKFEDLAEKNLYKTCN